MSYFDHLRPDTLYIFDFSDRVIVFYDCLISDRTASDMQVLDKFSVLADDDCINI